MSVVSIASVRPLAEPELDQVGQLAVTLSAQLTRVPSSDIEPTMAQALEQVAAATRVDICQLIEFSESGTVARACASTPGAGTEDLALPSPVSKEWLVPRPTGTGKELLGRALHERSRRHARETPCSSTLRLRLAREAGGGVLSPRAVPD